MRSILNAALIAASLTAVALLTEPDASRSARQDVVAECVANSSTDAAPLAVLECQRQAFAR